MNRFLKPRNTFVLIGAIVLAAVLVPRAVFAVSADDQDARNVAIQWLSLLDAGRYEQAYAEFAPRIKETVLKDNFLRGAHARRTPLGRPKSRSLYQAKHTAKLIGNPDGNYQDLAFKSSFEHKAQAVERVVLTKETGHWRILGYRIY